MVVSPTQVDILPHYCTNTKPLHCHLTSDFSSGRSILHTVLQHDRRRLITFPDEVKRNKSETSRIRCSISGTRCFDWLASSWPHPAECKLNAVRSGLGGRPCRWPTTPNPRKTGRTNSIFGRANDLYLCLYNQLFALFHYGFKFLTP